MATVLQAFLKSAWEAYVRDGAPIVGIPPKVAASWERSRRVGANPHGGYCREALPADEYSARRAASADFIEVARPFMFTLHEMVRGSGFAVVLVDKDGLVLEVLRDESIPPGSDSASGFVPGTVWREEVTGNTAIGSALRSALPVQMAGYEHYCQAHHLWSCSAAPVLGPNREVLGAVNVSGPVGGVHPHTLGMVVAAARAIEGQITMRQATEQLQIQHKYQQAIMESMSDGLLTIDNTGRLTYMNENAGRILGVDHRSVIGEFVGDIVDFEPVVLSVLKTGKGYVDKEFMVKTGAGFKHFVKTAVPIHDENGRLTGVVDTFREIKRVRKMINKMTGAQASFTFSDILGESPELLESVRLARIAAECSSNVLIQGESGTGKELFAQAIHNGSDRRDGPFIALNCAALPRELVESEIFGYEEGSFTGASRDGRPGKFELASGGTMFFDEIGEMPLDTQAKLLRVLQEKRVLRLGGTHYIECNVRLIAATNKDLVREVEEGDFRSDLFYRLNVMSIEIPPLRARRADLDILTSHLIERMTRRLARPPCSFSREAMQILRSYSWPGNVRELENVVECAVNMAHGSEISADQVTRLLRRQGRPVGGNTEISSMDDLECDAVRRALQVVNGNVSLAARILRISRTTLYNKIKKYHIRAK